MPEIKETAFLKGEEVGTETTIIRKEFIVCLRQRIKGGLGIMRSIAKINREKKDLDTITGEDGTMPDGVLNVSKGNMYEFVTHTFNVIKGRCLHDCEYCYMKIFKQHPLRMDFNELLQDLGKGNFIFVGSSTDMFAEEVPEAWITATLLHLNKFENRYLFQSKNPKRMYSFKDKLPKNSVVGTTIETNRTYSQMGKTPDAKERASFIGQFDSERFVTLEPLMDFDVDELVSLVKIARPTFVNIGADSKGHHLPEPSRDKILNLVEELSKFTEIKKKSNLKRLLEEKIPKGFDEFGRSARYG